MAGESKKRAQRIDLGYFKRPTALGRWRTALSIAAPAAGLLWLAWHAADGSAAPFNGGTLASAHAAFARRCERCHAGTGGIDRSVTDAACRTCHAGPEHHAGAGAGAAPPCAACHREHRGRDAQLARVADQACTGCHAELPGDSTVAREVHDFGGQHPEFAARREGFVDPGKLALNHAVHLKPGLLAPEGPVRLVCEDCHRPDASAAGTPAPVRYAAHCARCHPLGFDARFTEVVPHVEPARVRAFVRLRLLSVAPDPAWAEREQAAIERVLWRKTCRECHRLVPGPDDLPQVAPVAVTPRWMPHAVFSHRAHRVAVCSTCHAAPSSQATADVLLPGIATCRACHGPASADDRCDVCHRYHGPSDAVPLPAPHELEELTASR